MNSLSAKPPLIAEMEHEKKRAWAEEPNSPCCPVRGFIMMMLFMYFSHFY